MCSWHAVCHLFRVQPAGCCSVNLHISPALAPILTLTSTLPLMPYTRVCLELPANHSKGCRRMGWVHKPRVSGLCTQPIRRLQAESIVQLVIFICVSMAFSWYFLWHFMLHSSWYPTHGQLTLPLPSGHLPQCWRITYRTPAAAARCSRPLGQVHCAAGARHAGQHATQLRAQERKVGVLGPIDAQPPLLACTTPLLRQLGGLVRLLASNRLLPLWASASTQC